MTTEPPPALQPETFTLYRVATGEVIGSLTCLPGFSSVTAANPAIGEVLGKADTATQFVDITQVPPAVAARAPLAITVDKTSIAAGGADFCTFSGVPTGATVAIDSNLAQSCPSPMTFAATDVGTYTLTFSAFPALDQAFEIVAS